MSEGKERETVGRRRGTQSREKEKDSTEGGREVYECRRKEGHNQKGTDRQWEEERSSPLVPLIKEEKTM